MEKREGFKRGPIGGCWWGEAVGGRARSGAFMPLVRGTCLVFSGWSKLEAGVRIRGAVNNESSSGHMGPIAAGVPALLAGRVV